ncbi:MAG: hypothetical protein LAO78_06080 [Acidobacteriia bacterium]|nr:hypothetical protein [Terriglobia bacterium]
MKRITASKSKKPRKVTPRPRPTQTADPLHMMEHTADGGSFIQFPQIKGKRLEKIQLHTTAEYHSIDLDFDDWTGLTLRLGPRVALRATYFNLMKGSKTVKEKCLPVHRDGG